MEIQLQELIDRIKKDGVSAAESEAATILESANSEARQIIENAKAEAEAIMQKAKDENDRAMRAAEDAIRQAGRNVIISFRDSVKRELDAIIGERVPYAYSKEALSAVVLKVTEAWAKDPDAEDISVLLNPEDLSIIENTLLASLKERMLEGITLKPNENFDGGFRIAVNGGTAYYDYSFEAVAQMLSAYLNPKVSALLKEADAV